MGKGTGRWPASCLVAQGCLCEQRGRYHAGRHFGRPPFSMTSTSAVNAQPPDRAWMRWTLLGWLVFVIYGSLVPLDFRPMPLAQAWTLLKAAPFLNIGAGGRADWIANGVLFLPIGLLSTVLLRGARACGTWRALAAGLLALAFGGGLAVGIEFTQLFFSGRTVSLNDILSECVGTLLGMLLA